ncbi:hypothetical protein EU546_01190 [Candidatus Thorarchaeota archaeon]|nr:MAG: hypothetical protein EU546_01190 [Candidatus Thorarchaeota archaeon]
MESVDSKPVVVRLEDPEPVVPPQRARIMNRSNLFRQYFDRSKELTVPWRYLVYSKIAEVLSGNSKEE